MTRDAIIARIKKLLALSADNPNPHEAAAAALKAQALIAEHGIDDYEVHGKQSDQVVECATETRRGAKWTLFLAKAIADNFRCKVYRRAAIGGKQYVFVGYDTDASAASIVFDRLYETGERLAAAEARAAYKNYGTASGVKATYLIGYDGTSGFVGGIRSELEKQTQALMLVMPTAVCDYWADRSSKMKLRTSTYHYSTARRPELAREGFQAGAEAVRRTRHGQQLSLDFAA